jgi:ribosomal protein S18 acetylase RimI-like enzyme
VEVGDVVSLRVQTDAGVTEVVGIVLAASADSLTLRRRDGGVLDVAVTQVTASRVVPPSPAQRIPVDELERVMTSGWRALRTRILGEWVLRAGDGLTRRANSALPLGDPGLAPADAVAAVRDWYGEHHLAARVQVPSGAVDPEIARALDADGWVEEPGVRTRVLSAELGPVRRGTPGDGQLHVQVDEIVDDAWLAAWRADGEVDREIARRLLTNHDTVGFASVREGGDCVAIARAAVDGRWAGLFAVEVAAGHRGRGLGRAVSLAALRWAVPHGARRAYLQVEDTNTTARSLYESLGFTGHHDYTYLVAPDT